MAFQIRPIKEFLVRPALPPALSRLSELATNIVWTWDHNVRAVFRRLDPVLWKACGYNPLLMLGRIPQAALERHAADPRFLTLYRRACERYDSYINLSEAGKSDKLIAYFSMEYGLAESLAIYSGGLGLLSGDHLKAASDADLPLVAVGLLYQKGYLQQFLNPDGWQQERYPINDFYTLPIEQVCDAAGNELKVVVHLPTGDVQVKVWRANVGRVKLYLLDTNVPENTRPNDRDITDSLYGGDINTRIRQEIVLGIGGLRALKALGYEPTVFHMNEGHSAFLAIERIRLLMQERGLTFDEGLDASRQNNVFTTHTSVPAGIDIFDDSLLWEYFNEYCNRAGISFDQLRMLGKRSPKDIHDNKFSMAILAFNASAFRNAVSKLHRTVSQEMWQDLWPGLPTHEVSITSITNGVHLPTWLSGDFATLYDQYLQPDWRERYNEPRTWDLVSDIPDQELWEAHRRQKRQLITFCREWMVRFAIARKASSSETRRLGDVLDPEVFTIGFARRFATYKRATLLLRDVNRLKKLLTNPDMPVQIVIAGKAHPKDHPGKGFIREIVQLSRDPAVSKRLVFLEDYGIEVARNMVQGVDLWLNNPRRGEEACGTSGMKAGLNGVLNLSILDGWFDEAYEVSGGWAIGDRIPYFEDQDELHASAIYSLLENEIVPMYYSGGDDGVPDDWVRRMKQCLMSVSPMFNCQRMVGEYMERLYEPAHDNYQEVRRESFELARRRARWMHSVHEAWGKVRFLELGPGPDASVMSGSPIAMRTVVDLAGLTPEDVRVEAVIGRVGVEGQLENTEVLALPAIEQKGAAWVFEKEYLPQQTGRLGYALRISPNHDDDPLTRPCHSLIKWGLE